MIASYRLLIDEGEVVAGWYLPF